MKLKDAFKRFLNDEFPPELVFCVYNNEIKSIKLKELDSYESTYRFLHKDNPFKLPTLTKV